MKIAVLGTGTVGRTVAGALAERGHDVVVGTRDPESTVARTEADGMGNPPFAQWQAGHAAVALASYADAAAQSELVINATSGAGSLAALEAAGAANLDGKILVDIANPLDFSQGMPPSLNPVNSDSLGEQIQRAFPAVKVVKTLNTMNAHLMVDPGSVADGDHSVFVSGNDADAKRAVTELLGSLGHTDVIDLGDITTARGSEMLLPIWLRLWGALGTPAFNFKIAR
ncbi:NAD(P)-binding domain-containing protein [Paenarthrobacter sp. DKR-5]|uniref:NADPH-dependent F420 reductase n=1 Tax=Paenarthrobacter sp. DKR-5 TaxID=2835535 RepID=UPI001BDC2E34|nr:NAD(P)-binding domain-containing protein [Paenarthrobacter sp. DKR-5]MBT1004251.1 NAD(P)-binding domain-containing protein [Paenarthrobacter sp. DKR-5]